MNPNVLVISLMKAYDHAGFDTICVIFLFAQRSPEVLRNQGLRAFAISVRGVKRMPTVCIFPPQT